MGPQICVGVREAVEAKGAQDGACGERVLDRRGGQSREVGEVNAGLGECSKGEVGKERG